MAGASRAEIVGSPGPGHSQRVGLHVEVVAMLRSVVRPSGHPVSRVVAVLAVIGVAAVAIGCTGVRGEGAAGAETRQITSFSRVDVSYGIDVVVAIGPARPIEVRAQPNILPLVTTSVDGDTLRVAASRELDPLAGVTVLISVPDLRALALSGGSDGTVTSYGGQQLDVAMTGGGDLTASGTADIVSIVASGGSEVHFGDLSVGTLDVQLSGGSTVDARVSDAVRGSASGGAHVTVAGPAVLNVQASGGATVERH